MERVRPELRGKSGTSKHGTNSISDGLMRALTRAILIRGSRSGRLDGITSKFKKADHLRGTTKFTTKIKANVLVGSLDRKTVTSKPAIDEIDRRLLGGETFTVKSTTVMIDNKAIAGFTIETGETAETFHVLGRLDKEANIDGNTLIGHGGTTRVIGRAIAMA